MTIHAAELEKPQGTHPSDPQEQDVTEKAD
jgi:hypothetical protein